PLGVGPVDEPREPLRAAVGRMDRVRVEAVVAQAALAWKRRHPHQLARGYPELAQAAQAGDDAVEGALLAERADVQLVDHELVEREGGPARAAPPRHAG